MIKVKTLLNYIFWLFIALFAVIQVITLDKSPLPWFDETFFASIAHQWSLNGNLTPQVAIFQEVKLYGPIYFWLTGISFKLLGFSIFSFRLVNLLSGIGVVWMSGLIIKQITTNSKTNGQTLASKTLLKWWWVLLLTDPLFYLVLHEGRMDLMTLFWALSSIYVLLPFLTKTQNQDKLIGRFILSGFLVTVAALTTPRVGFIFVPFSMLLLWRCRRKFYLFIIWGITIVGLYAIWVFTAFGNIDTFIAYYTGNNPFANISMTAQYLGGFGYIPRQSYPLIISAILGLIVIILQKPVKILHPYVWIALVSIGLFYPLIHDYGQYSIFIIPFYYFFIFYGLSIKVLHFKNLMLYPLLFLLVLNVGYFTLKNLQVLASWEQRKPATATQFIQKHIHKGARVVGEPMYFYAVHQVGGQYQYMDLYETLEAREARQRQKFKYQYLIVTDHLRWRKPQIVKYYIQTAKLQEIARLKTPPSYWSQQIARLGLVSNVERDGYNCVIYKRVE